MFSKNIIVLLCFVCIIEKSSTAGGGLTSEDKSVNIPAEISGTPNIVPEDSRSTESIEYDDSSSTKNDEQWEFLFQSYVTQEDGLIALPELQKLLFKELNGFFTVRQLELYTNLINSRDNGIDLKLLKKMEQIIQYLSKGQSYNIDNKNVTSFTDDIFIIEIKKILDYKKLFLEGNDISEVSELLDLIENWPIDYPMFEKILKMLSVSQKMAQMYEEFSMFKPDENGGINATNMIAELTDNGKAMDTDKTIESVNEFFKKGDKKRDGSVDFLEYAALIMKSKYKIIQ